MTTNKTTLIETVAELSGVTKSSVKAVIDTLFSVVADNLRENNSVAILPHGTFIPVVSAARVGRNPQNGQPLQIPASKTVKFKAAPSYKAILNA